MTEIYTIKGEKYSFDPETERIFKDGVLLGIEQVEPIYSKNTEDNAPRFSGIYLKDINSILSLSGKINPITNINSIQ